VSILDAAIFRTSETVFDMHEAYRKPYSAENPRKPVRWMRTGLLSIGQVSLRCSRVVDGQYYALRCRGELAMPGASILLVDGVLIAVPDGSRI